MRRVGDRVRGRLFWGLTAFVVLGACTPYQLSERPSVPVALRAADYEVVVDEVVVNGAPTSLLMKTRLRMRGTLTAASLASDSAPPCGGAGPASSVIEVDGETRWQRPISLDGDAHRVAFAFPQQEYLAVRVVPGVLFLDLAVAGDGVPACLRVPVGGTAVAWRKTNDWSAGGNIGFYPAFGLGGSVGRWVGPVRLGLDAGVATHACADCPRVATLLLPASLTAEGFVYSRLGPALGLKLGYDAVPGFALGGPRDAYFRHGPTIGVKVVSAQPAAGFAYGPAVFAGYLSATAAFRGQGAPFSGPRT